VLLRMKQVNRLRFLPGYMDGKIEIEEASKILKRSLRSVYRMVAKVREKKPEGVLHGNRNKVSPRRVPDYIRKKLTELALRKMCPLRESPENCLDRCKGVWCKSYYINVRHFLSWVKRPLTHRSRERLK
jgi:transposase